VEDQQKAFFNLSKVLETWGLLNRFEVRFTLQKLICAMAKNLNGFKLGKKLHKV
jgi:hypothetical protein